MAETKRQKSEQEQKETSKRGFASMDPKQQREIASKGGKAAAAHGDTSKRGFASMDPELQRAIASKGGKAAHASGNAHEFKAGSKEAKEAGRKGGQNSHSGGAHAH